MIDAKHRAAVEALDLIAAYLDELPEDVGGSAMSALVVARRNGSAKAARPQTQPRNARPLRESVIERLEFGAATVQEIADDTGLEVRQVRGVVNAPDLKNRTIFRFTRDDGKTVYTTSTETGPKPF
ncbi:MAG: hypothetical protein KY476_03490 [Planctomycetes bacterium]|nr:hypothetical protein [Planctomycetota bacterium]